MCGWDPGLGNVTRAAELGVGCADGGRGRRVEGILEPKAEGEPR